MGLLVIGKVELGGIDVMKVLLIVCVLVGMFATVTIASAQELGPGDAAPPFSLIGSDGAMHSLSDLTGRTVVLAWFLKAFTGG
jgi:peroxiredoxin Q/BCP|tara:strand:+ start:2215 stop:2463 length:249 start_codon:yes stop_codon:yes gene_type:complete